MSGRSKGMVVWTVLAVACGGGGSGQDQGPGDTLLGDQSGPDVPGMDAQPQAVETAKSSLERQKDPAVPPGDAEALAEGNAAFAFNLYHRLADEKGDFFVAPLSVSIALAQVSAGAKGQTAQEIANALHFTLSQDRLHPAFNALDLALESRGSEPAEEGDPFQLSIVNALWGQKGYPFESSYLDLLALNYGAGFNLVDYASDPEGARLAINDWVAGQTNDRIKDLLGPGTVDTLTRLVLTNAIYFKAGWMNKFKAELTDQQPFHRLDGSTVPVDLMHMETMTDLPHAKTDDCEAVALPYVGEKVAMVIVLPALGKFEAVEAGVDGAGFLEILDSLAMEEGTVALPKFGMETKASLAEALAGLGMNIPFTTDADFTGISSTGELYISDVIHQTFLAVDEEGTEAAGATAVIFEGTSFPPPEPFEMVVDRPFVFAIVDLPTRAVLFLGRMSDPSGS